MNKRRTACCDAAQCLLACLFAMVCLVTTPATSAAQSASEYQLKAAYLYHFTQFVEWPQTAFDAPDSTFNLCVMGDDPFRESIAPLANRRYHGHPIIILHPETSRTSRECHLLYIASSVADQVATILSSLKDLPILTVSSIPKFTEQGGDIEFVHVDNHVRFSINRASTLRHGLVCSAKLLEVAVQVLNTALIRALP